MPWLQRVTGNRQAFIPRQQKFFYVHSLFRTKRLLRMMKELTVAALVILALSSAFASPLLASQLRFQSDVTELIADIFKNGGLKRNKPGLSPAQLAQMHAIVGLGKRTTIGGDDIARSLRLLRSLNSEFESTDVQTTRQERRPSHTGQDRYEEDANPFHDMDW